MAILKTVRTGIKKTLMALAGGVAFLVLLALFTLLALPAPPTAGATFAGVSLKLDYATTTAKRELGLGGRAEVPQGYGLLFIFPRGGSYGFWMKDMLVPIDIFWLDDKGQVVSFEPNVAPATYPHVFYPNAPARYVLETAAGFASAHGVSKESRLKLQNFDIVSE